MRLQPVQRGQLRSGLRVPAQVLALPAQRHALEVRASGWVQRLVVSTEGQPVRAGELLAELYLPEVEALRVELGLAPELAAGAAERLRRLGIAERDITALREGRLRQRLPLRAPADGVVSELAVVEGQRVDPGSRLFLIEGRQQWLQARVPLSRAHALAEGVHSARLRLPHEAGWWWLDGEWQRAELVDSLTQTQAWRLALDTLTEGLPIGSYAEVELFGPPRPPQLLVPRSAVLRHADEARVVRRDAQGRLGLQRVRLGAAEGGQAEVLEGLAPGDSVVVRAQFLIEAEAELDGVLQRWARTPPPAHDHCSHDHGSHNHSSHNHSSHDHSSHDHSSHGRVSGHQGHRHD